MPAKRNEHVHNQMGNWRLHIGQPASIPRCAKSHLANCHEHGRPLILPRIWEPSFDDRSPFFATVTNLDFYDSMVDLHGSTKI